MIGLNFYNEKLLMNFSYLKMKLIKKIKQKQNVLLKKNGKKIIKKKVEEVHTF